MEQLFLELFIAFSATLAITAMLMPFFIAYFTAKKIGQVTREEGPKWHDIKTGTPTMGGIAFVIATSITVVIMSIYQKTLNASIFLLLFVFIAFAIIGFLDDYLKLIRQHNEGLTSKQKFIAQMVCSLLFVVFFYLLGNQGNIYILFIGSVTNVIVFTLFSAVWLTGFSNAVNLTDGLDGLVAGTASIALGAYTYIAYQQNRMDIMIFCIALIGGLVGFFIFNKKPAKIFMGDVGSLALGAVFAVLSILLHVEWSLLIIGSIFVLETASVMLQVTSYKLFKKRVFKMSPIHHHFEMSGWGEWKVVIVFWLIGLMSAIIYTTIF